MPFYLNFLPYSRLLLCTQESENVLTTQESENVLTTNASVIGPNNDQYVWLTEDMMNDIIYIPTWWHDCIISISQQLDSIKEVRLAPSTAPLRRNVCDFVKNNKRRITVKCLKKWDNRLRLEAPCITDNTHH